MHVYTRIIVACIVYLAIGTIGFYTVEPDVTWLDSVIWASNTVFSPGSDFEPTNKAAKVFQSCYIAITFLWVLYIGAQIVPIFIRREESKTSGQDVVHRHQLRYNRRYFVATAVDWEKVESLYKELEQQLESNDFHLVVVAENLPPMPSHLMRQGVRFIKGVVRDQDTWQRAGLQWATGVFVCAPSYSDIKHDGSVAMLVDMIKRLQPSVITVAEGISRANRALFSSGNRLFIFDAMTLKAIAEKVRQELDGRSVQFIAANTCDKFQARELLWQLHRVTGICSAEQCRLLAEKLHEQGTVQVSDQEGISLRIALPPDLDDPGTSDGEVWAMLRHAWEVMSVGMYCSVMSRDTFHGMENVVCVDGGMARLEVQAMLHPDQDIDEDLDGDYAVDDWPS